MLGIDVTSHNVFVTRRNIRLAGLAECVSAHLASWEDLRAGHFDPGAVDLIVSNPPYVPAGDGRVVDGGPRGSRVLTSIIDGLPHSTRGIALLLSSLSDPLNVLARIERQGFSVRHLFAESVPFGRYTSAPPTLAALQRLRTGGSAWFYDTDRPAQRDGDAPAAPHAYLRIGVIAQRTTHAELDNVISFPPRQFPGRVGPHDPRRALAHLLAAYHHGGPATLAGLVDVDAPGREIRRL